MCGICLILICRSKLTEENPVICSANFEDFLLNINRRGPDNIKEIQSSYGSFELQFLSSILHLRGFPLQSQPVQDEKGNILIWNGEIFDGPLHRSSQSDTKLLSEKLFTCYEVDDVLNVMGSIYGPYAFIFYQVNSRLVWFGRDIFGRRSLLYNSDGVFFKLCSVADHKENWQEVPTTGTFCLDLNESQQKNLFALYHYPWSKSASGTATNTDEKYALPNLNMHNKPNTFAATPILKPLNRQLPSDGILNLFFQAISSETNSELINLSLLMDNETLKSTLSDFEEVLSHSVERRVQNQLSLCKECYALLNSDSSGVKCNHASLGVLFSGGLDSIVIAALAHRHLPRDVPVDLLNVAFSNREESKDSDALKQSPFDTPDRLTGKSGASALTKLYPTRSWNFVEINVSKEELIAERTKRLSQLLKPSCTVLDDSIGCAIWFAARGKGRIQFEEKYTNYTSPVRVLLVGMGADEQLGGYSRHRAKFNNFGWPGLVEELSMELDRIGSRNLGRDDRIIADNSVESRYPFLDENVVSFLNGLPVWLKMNLNLPRGLGEKLLLRLLAFSLGLKEASVLPKRAIQFGSRIARIENNKEKGSDICERLKQTL